ncbi:MAG: hypothetical protein FJ025_01305 [Chloroflexi bacterium]|nr:hypothetical protein [Chloroflexota bacterium]
MNPARQLFQLQELELEIESDEQTLSHLTSQLGESQTVIKAREKLATEQNRLDALKHQQHDLENEIEDISAKLSTIEDGLFSGRVKNPKELSNLQHEAQGMKAKRSQLEDRVLELMEQTDSAAATITNLSNDLKKLEAEWQTQQQKLSADIEQLKAKLAELKQKRQQLSATIDPKALELYRELRKQKGLAIAKVEQGICRGCRISLSAAELQQARGNNLIQCSSCNRILFAA